MIAATQRRNMNTTRPIDLTNICAYATLVSILTGDVYPSESSKLFLTILIGFGNILTSALLLSLLCVYVSSLIEFMIDFLSFFRRVGY